MKITFTEEEVQQILVDHCKSVHKVDTKDCKINMTCKSYSEIKIFSEIELSFTEKEDENKLVSGDDKKEQ